MSGALLAASLPGGIKGSLSGEGGIGDATISPTIAFVGVRTLSNGFIQKREGATYTSIDTDTDYVIPRSDAANWHVRCTDNLGTLNGASAATGVWLATTSTRLWFISQVSVGNRSFDVTLEISRDGGATVVDSANYTGLATMDV